MRADRIAVVAVALILGGCSMSMNSRVADDSPIWGRIDCQRGEGNPELQKEFDDAKAICLARGESEETVAGNVGNSPCMTEQGYVLRTRAGHASACQGAGAQKAKPATPARKSDPKSRGAGAKPATSPEPTEPVAPPRQ